MKENHKKRKLSKGQWINIACILITTIVVVLAFVKPFLIQGNTDILGGGDSITLEKAGSSIYYILLLRNSGLGQSEEVELHIHFPEGVTIDYEYTNGTIEPRHNDLEIISSHECYYGWDYLNSGEIVSLTLILSIDSELGTYIVPVDISLREKY